MVRVRLASVRMAAHRAHARPRRAARSPHVLAQGGAALLVRVRVRVRLMLTLRVGLRVRVRVQEAPRAAHARSRWSCTSLPRACASARLPSIGGESAESTRLAVRPTSSESRTWFSRHASAARSPRRCLARLRRSPSWGVRPPDATRRGGVSWLSPPCGEPSRPGDGLENLPGLGSD